MEKSRKKELTDLYKRTKPQMGIFIIRSKVNNKCYIQTTQDLRGVMNGAMARLRGGGHTNRELQKEWTEYGAENFTMEILETLDYDADEMKTDYKEELSILQLIWEEKLAKEGMALYKKRP